MPDPFHALLAFAVAAAAAAVVLWPRHGLLARHGRRAMADARVRLEDAVKHCYTAESAGRPASLESVAGALAIPLAEAARLAARLGEEGLADADGGALRLTERGRAQALRLVRSHRLVERYLADRTGLPPGEWHEEAERLEHRLTAADTARLSAAMGHPLVDPHGDPIPTELGELPEGRGTALAALPAGAAARVTHVEDEPRETFDRLVAQGVVPGAVLTRLAAPGALVRYRLDGAVHDLDALAAAGVTVEPLADGEDADTATAHDTLGAVRPGESARVLRIAAACQGPQRRRLLDLGVVPGTVITAELEGASGDPVAYRIRGALIALRRHHADWIVVERVPAGSGAP
jgi:DtxR family Mn-dependent transcriptional regulator